MSLRDWIGHAKPEREDHRKVPKALESLIRSGLVYPRPDNVTGSWLDLLITDRIAEWACRTSLEMIRKTLDLVPPGNPRQHTGVDFLRAGSESWPTGC